MDMWLNMRCMNNCCLKPLRYSNTRYYNYYRNRGTRWRTTAQTQLNELAASWQPKLSIRSKQFCRFDRYKPRLSLRRYHCNRDSMSCSCLLVHSTINDVKYLHKMCGWKRSFQRSYSVLGTKDDVVVIVVIASSWCPYSKCLGSSKHKELYISRRRCDSFNVSLKL